jgi:Flp pilus assembly pilin Flp
LGGSSDGVILVPSAIPHLRDGVRFTVTERPKGVMKMTKLYTQIQSLAAALRERESGQTMAEYAIVLAVITVAIIGTLGFLAGGINSTIANVTSTL